MPIESRCLCDVRVCASKIHFKSIDPTQSGEICVKNEILAARVNCISIEFQIVHMHSTDLREIVSNTLKNLRFFLWHIESMHLWRTKFQLHSHENSNQWLSTTFEMQNLRINVTANMRVSKCTRISIISKKIQRWRNAWKLPNGLRTWAIAQNIHFTWPRVGWQRRTTVRASTLHTAFELCKFAFSFYLHNFGRAGCASHRK